MKTKRKNLIFVLAICATMIMSPFNSGNLYADDDEHLGKNIQTSVTISVEEGEKPDFIINNEGSLQIALNDKNYSVIPIQKDIILTKSLTIPANRGTILIKSVTSNPVTLSISEEYEGIRHFELLNDTNLSFDNVILDGGDIGGGINIGDEQLGENNPSISVSITNPIIQNCYYPIGGGIWLLPNASLELHGGTIKNSCGYSNSGNIYIDKDSTLVMEETVLSDNEQGTAVEIGDNALFTMLSGSISDNKVGIFSNANEAKFLLRNGIIKDNETGVKIEGVDSEFTMNGGIISDNDTYGIDVDFGLFTMNEGTINNNVAAGVYIANGKFILNDGIIEDNEDGVYMENTIFEMNGGIVQSNGNSDGTGGSGIAIIYENFDTTHLPVITGGEIKGNSNLGLSINWSGNIESVVNLLIKGITIKNNGIDALSLNGGLLLGVSDIKEEDIFNITLENVVISGNKNERDGGGLYVGGNISDVILKNVEIKNNHALGEGGGIFIDGNEFPTNLIIQGDTYFSGNTADQAYWIEKDTRPEAIALKTKYDTDYRQFVKSLSASPGDSASFNYMYNNYDVAFIGEEGSETSPGVGRIVFHDSTNISNLDYKVTPDHDGSLLVHEGDKPKLNIFNNVGSNYNLRLSYDSVKASNNIIPDITFALRGEENHSNIEPLLSHIVNFDNSLNEETFITTVPWLVEGKPDSDLLKLNFPVSRLNLVGKNINTTLYWSLEITP